MVGGKVFPDEAGGGDRGVRFEIVTPKAPIALRALPRRVGEDPAVLLLQVIEGGTRRESKGDGGLS